jgi:uncharacterized protein YdhG (YjbR/CyaY superfamily)
MAANSKQQKPAKNSSARASSVLTAEERAAMKEMIAERRGGGQGEAEVLARIARMPEADRKMAERLHALITAAAPGLTPKTWYGMPAYAKDDKVICYFQDANKFKARYATLGFSDKARLDEGEMWPVAFALKQLTPADEKKIVALVKKAMG